MFKQTLIFAFALSASSALADDVELKCEIGPVLKIYGNSPWKVFGCNEEAHLMFVAAPGSPAGQVIFMLFSENGRWTVMDMGSGTRYATAARSEIQSLSEAQIAGLIAETKAAARSGAGTSP